MRRAALTAVMLVVVVGAHAAHVARAHADTNIDTAKSFVLQLTGPVLDVNPPTSSQEAEVLAGLSTPFWYDGFSFASADDPAAAKRCKKTFSRAGTVKDTAKLATFTSCLTYAMFSGALDGDAEWLPVDLKKLPRPFKKHKAKLTKLAKDPTVTLVISHFIPAGPAEYWDLWIVKTDASGAQKLAGILVVNE
jgi:hypothetical protein